jgi:hypothetical protein
MSGYVIVPRARAYWIEWTDADGSRRPVERFEREDIAVRRLRALKAEAEAAELRLAGQRPPRYPP